MTVGTSGAVCARGGGRLADVLNELLGGCASLLEGQPTGQQFVQHDREAVHVASARHLVTHRLLG
jgi:hypothetical protein